METTAAGDRQLGLKQMERHDLRHRQFRVELPRGLRNVEVAAFVENTLRRLRLLPATTTMVGLASFVVCGIAVVATASLIAIQIP